MTPNRRILLAIAAFVIIGLGSFVYFITNWDASKAEPIGATAQPTHSFVTSRERPRGPPFLRNLSERHWQGQSRIPTTILRHRA